MAEKIVQHGHCHICGRVVRYGETTCSAECKTRLEKEMKKRKYLVFLMYGLALVFLVLFIGPTLFGGG